MQVQIELTPRLQYSGFISQGSREKRAEVKTS